jgi:hypothetical protein
MRHTYSFARTIRQSLLGIVLVSIGLQIAGSSVGLAWSRSDKGAVVNGVAWNTDNAPIAGAKVRLRETHSGEVEADAITNEQGQFSFNSVAGGAYVVELMDASGKVLAVGQGFRVESGETVATFVRLPPRRPRIAGLFSNAATAVIAAAASVGITPLGPNGSGSRPISPQ